MENARWMEPRVYAQSKRLCIFYYKSKVILDPWMNEKSQVLPWPDHESRQSAVNSVEYYGQKTIEDYLVNLFLFRPEWAPEISDKIKKNLNDTGRLKRIATTMPIEVYIAMSEEQANEEHGSVCIEWELPDSKRVYYVLNHIALYFSRELPLNSVTDVGDWKLELVNAEVEIFVYQKFFL